MIIKDFCKLFFLRLRSFAYVIRFSFRGVFVHPLSYIAKGVTIGRHTRINHASYLEKCEIGSFCAIAGRLIIRNNNHRMEYLNLNHTFQEKKFGSVVRLAGGVDTPVKVGNAVWIGDRVVILAGVNVGDGAVIGAGSVVVRDVEPYSIVAGNPAKLIRYRFSVDVVRKLSGFRWWEFDDADLKFHRNRFVTPVEELDWDDF